MQRLIFLLCAFTSVAVAQSKPIPIELPPGNVKSKPRRMEIPATAIIKGPTSICRLTLGNSNQVQVGQVVAIGNPLSLESTVSNGIISGVRTADELGGTFLQITSPISPGSSGGPLFDTAGEAIGITTVGLKGGENLNFAIPINDVKRLLVATPGAATKNFPHEPEPKEAQSETAQNPTMEGQKICSEQAYNVLQKTKRMPGNDDEYVTLNIVNHYDPSMSICFVEISKSRRLPRQIAEAGTFTKASLTESDGGLRAFSIEDAFGGNTVGDLIQVFPYEHPPQICKIQPPGQPEIHCASDTEFHNLAFKYFGISK